MKKFMSAIAVLLILTSGVAALSGCAGKDRISLSTEIAEAMASVDEAAVVTELAREKDGLCLAENGASDFVIAVPDDASEFLKRHAQYFVDVFKRMTGAELPLLTKSEAAISSRVIYVGIAPDGAEFPDNDGYILRTEKSGGREVMYICGREEAATVNGIYGFLEDELKCMFVREDFDYIPKTATVWLGNTDKTASPDFAWRKVYQAETAENEWSARLRNNGTAPDGSINSYYGWGTWCHSFYHFVPPSEYFESHPEYFSMIDGERAYFAGGIDGQLCFSNPDIYGIVEARLAELIEKDEADAAQAGREPSLYWDFSVMDGGSRCTCAECEKAYVDCGGTLMGQLIPFLNRLAARFPDKMISTLAYQRSIDVPTKLVGENGEAYVPEGGIKCADNVVIKLCSMIGSQGISYLDGSNKGAGDFKRQVEQWSAVSKNLVIWDYVVNFSNLLLPYPNYAVQTENARFYAEHNVKGVFHQGSREKGDEMARLRTYVLSRQMWDIDVDINALIARYLVVTYKSAAPYIAEYLDEMSARVLKAGKDVNLYDEPSAHASGYLSAGAINSYNKIFINAVDAAEKAEETDVLERLEEIEINLLYAKMFEPGLDVKGKEAAFVRFRILAEKLGITMVYEWKPDMTEFTSEVYPEYLKTQKSYLAAAIAVPIAVAALAAGAAVLFVLKKRSKKTEDSPSK